ncbi:MAG: transcription antitermination factor NusB [Mycoplasmatales bacterium]
MKHAKSYAREKVIKGLYELKINNSEISTLVKINDPLALQMMIEIKEQETKLNEYIKKYIKKWSLQEMNPVNIAILHLGVYELLQKELDSKIVISESIKLASEYTDVKSKNFIHYVLDNINKELHG